MNGASQRMMGRDRPLVQLFQVFFYCRVGVFDSLELVGGDIAVGLGLPDQHGGGVGVAGVHEVGQELDGAFAEAGHVAVHAFEVRAGLGGVSHQLIGDGAIKVEEGVRIQCGVEVVDGAEGGGVVLLHDIGIEHNEAEIGVMREIGLVIVKGGEVGAVAELG